MASERRGRTSAPKRWAVGAALGVVEPFMSGLGGGGGFMTIYQARTGAVQVLDYVGRTPLAAEPTDPRRDGQAVAF